MAFVFSQSQAQGGTRQVLRNGSDGWTREDVAPGQSVMGPSGALFTLLHPTRALTSRVPLPSGLCWGWPTGSIHWDQRREGSGVRGVLIHLPGVFRMAASLYGSRQLLSQSLSCTALPPPSSCVGSFKHHLENRPCVNLSSVTLLACASASCQDAPAIEVEVAASLHCTLTLTEQCVQILEGSQMIYLKKKITDFPVHSSN